MDIFMEIKALQSMDLEWTPERSLSRVSRNKIRKSHNASAFEMLKFQ